MLLPPQFRIVLNGQGHGASGAGDMRTVAEYVAKAAEFKARAERTTDPALKKRYADLAASYQIMADERSRMIALHDEPGGDAPQSG